MNNQNRVEGLAIVFLLGLVLGVYGADHPLQKRIDKAVERGIAYLNQLQTADGSWTASYVSEHYKSGPTALSALTLLECGVSPKDDVIQKAAEIVRTAGINSTKTYSLSLSIMFLDRLGDDGDIPLIESMAVRLLAGQNACGGWSYQCPAIAPAEVTRLKKYYEQRRELISKGKLPRRVLAKPRTQRDLPKEIVAQLIQINRQGNGRLNKTWGDNSNTQFASLALWIARRKGLPVHHALARVAARFRNSQQPNGGWKYISDMGGPPITLPIGSTLEVSSTAAMTCAGLMGLAVGHGAVGAEREKKANRRPQPNPNKDRAIRNGLVALATVIGHPLKDPFGKDRDKIPVLGQSAGKAYYFLWSLERVGMIYGLENIGKKDWYTWGAQLLLANQAGDGSWKGMFQKGGVDTCFALLFLRRSNLARDLTATLHGQIPNAGEVALKSGGVGGSKLVLGKGVIPDIDPKRKTDPTNITPQPKERPSPLASPEDGQDAHIARLSTELVRAKPDDQERLITGLKNGKGLVYTEALGASIPLLTDTAKAKARTALVERLTRMTLETLRDKFQDDNLEIRRAAALACAKKGMVGSIPDLIAMLNDPEMLVINAAHAALKTLAGKDFGPDPDATQSERKTAAKRWIAWWKRQSGK